MLRSLRLAVVAGFFLLVFASTAAAAPPLSAVFEPPDRITSSAYFDTRVIGTVREEGVGVPDLVVFADIDEDRLRGGEEPYAVTRPDGTYDLRLDAGDYRIRLERPFGYLCVQPPSCVHPLSVTVAPVVADFSVVRQGTVAGTVVEDLTGDGIDPHDSGVDGMRIYLDRDGDGVRDAGEPSAASRPGGGYTFLPLQAGEYTVRLDADASWSCFAPASCAQTVTVADGRTTTLDFRVWRTATVRGTVFTDLDGDGRPRESGEPGSAGRTVYVDVDGDGRPDPGEPAATTADDGGYAIPGVAPGTQLVRVIEPQGWRCASPTPREGLVSVTSGSVRLGPDFGLADTASDLSVRLARTPDAVVAGESVVWTLTVGNAGPAIANNATLDVQLPGGLRDVSVQPPDGMDCGGVRPAVQCELGDLVVGASVDVHVRASVESDAAGDELPISAVVRADNDDRDVSDNTATEAPPVTGVADLRASASLPPAADVGEVVDLIVQLRNHGPSDATGLEVVATLPDGIDAVADELPDGCTVDERAVTCVAASVPVGEGFGWSIPVKVRAAAAGRALSVPVTAASDASDPTPADATAEVPFEARAVEPQPQPQADVVLDAPPAPPAVRECRSARVFDIRVSRRYGRLRKATMTLAGRPVAVRKRGGRFTARVDLRGLPAGEYVLKIRAVTDEGRVVRGERRYRTCSGTRIVRHPPL